MYSEAWFYIIKKSRVSETRWNICNPQALSHIWRGQKKRVYAPGRGVKAFFRLNGEGMRYATWASFVLSTCSVTTPTRSLQLRLEKSSASSQAAEKEKQKTVSFNQFLHHVSLLYVKSHRWALRSKQHTDYSRPRERILCSSGMLILVRCWTNGVYCHLD